MYMMPQLVGPASSAEHSAGLDRSTPSGGAPSAAQTPVAACGAAASLRQRRSPCASPHPGADGVTTCFERDVNLTSGCTRCWVDNVMCDLRRCVFSCLLYRMGLAAWSLTELAILAAAEPATHGSGHPRLRPTAPQSRAWAACSQIYHCLCFDHPGLGGSTNQGDGESMHGQSAVFVTPQLSTPASCG